MKMNSNLSRFEHGYGLVIGVGRTPKHPEYSLPATVRDATLLFQALTATDYCGYPYENVQLLTNGSATKPRILAAITDWLSKYPSEARDATITVYFSGHGLRTEEGRFALVPSDFDLERLNDSLLWDTEFSKALQSVIAKKLLIILDSCYAAGVAISKGDSGLPKGYQRSSPTESLFDLLKQGEGRVLLSSSKKNQCSWIRQDGQYSIFTYHLVEALKGADTPPDIPGVTMADVFNYVSRKVSEETRQKCNSEQTPWIEWNGENFVVARNPRYRDLGDPPVDPPPIDEEPPNHLYTQAEIFTLLTNALTFEELDELLFMHYPELYQRFGSSPFHDKRMKLADYCRTRNSFPELVAQIRKINPGAVETFEEQRRRKDS